MIVSEQNLITREDCDKCKDNMAEQINQIKQDVSSLKTSNEVIKTRLQNIDTSIQELKIEIRGLQVTNTDRAWDLVKILLPAILAFGAGWVLKG